MMDRQWNKTEKVSVYDEENDGKAIQINILRGNSGGWGETDARALVISNFSKTTACRHELARWEVHLGNKMT